MIEKIITWIFPTKSLNKKWKLSLENEEYTVELKEAGFSDNTGLAVISINGKDQLKVINILNYTDTEDIFTKIFFEIYNNNCVIYMLLKRRFRFKLLNLYAVQDCKFEVNNQLIEDSCMRT